MLLLSNVEYYWLRNRRFDTAFLLLPLLIGAAVAGFSTLYPSLFPYFLLADLWLLGYHHVISTYTRIAFDWVSAKRHYFLVFILPFIVLAGTFALYRWQGAWVIASVYLYWQWFHYTRQSYGISRYYLSRGGKGTPSSLYRPMHTLALYALPVTGILYRSWQHPETFLMMELKVIPVAGILVVAAAMASTLLVGWQLREWWRVQKAYKLNGSYVLFMLSHHVLFLVGYILIDDINVGWLCVNIWHNFQYILFVWIQNNQKFRAGIDPKQRLISSISQDGKIIQYMAVCLGITFFVYMVLSNVGYATEAKSVIAGSLLVFMVVNFHHYVVDAVIWRRKKSVKSV